MLYFENITPKDIIKIKNRTKWISFHPFVSDRQYIRQGNKATGINTRKEGAKPLLLVVDLTFYLKKKKNQLTILELIMIRKNKPTMPVLSTLIYKYNAILNRIARGFLPLGNSTKSLLRK